MPERITKTQRWLDLIALLLGRQVPLTVEQIMERVPAYAEGWNTGEEKERAATRRKFERDKDELRALGIPIETVPYAINYGAETFEGYRIVRRDFYLPYLRVLSSREEGEEGVSRSAAVPYQAGSVELSPDEASAAMDALRRIQEVPAFPFIDEARSAFSKLAFDLDPERYPATPVRWVDPPGAEKVLDRLNVIADALLARKRVRFQYHGIARGKTTERDVAGYGVFFHRDWYLVGHDAARRAVRVFRVARMEEVQPNPSAPKTPDYEVPAAFDLRTYVNRRPWELEDEPAVEVAVRFRFPATVWAERNREGERVREEADGTVVRRFSVTTPNPFLRWVLSFAGEAQIISPPGLVESFRRMASGVAALHEGADG